MAKKSSSLNRIIVIILLCGLLYLLAIDTRIPPQERQTEKHSSEWMDRSTRATAAIPSRPNGASRRRSFSGDGGARPTSSTRRRRTRTTPASSFSASKARGSTRKDGSSTRSGDDCRRRHLVFSTFRGADVFLYMDSDALLVRGDKTPTDMYEDLAFDGKGAEATMRHTTPGLIVNKPFTGWLCSECEKFGLGHGCFNSGVLLWHRERAEPVLRAWWESRNTDESHNFVRDGEWFHGWTSDEHAGRVGDDMGEQNRLMYVFATDPRRAGGRLARPTREERGRIGILSQRRRRGPHSVFAG